MHSFSPGFRTLFRLGVLALLLATSSLPVSAQIFISDYSGGKIAEYDYTTGALLNANFITGLTQPSALAVADGNLYVSSNGTIGKYDLTGAVINANLVTGAAGYGAIAIDGNNIYVVYQSTFISSSAIGVFDATTGAVVNAAIHTFGNGRDTYIRMAISDDLIYGINSDDFWQLSQRDLTGHENYAVSQPLYGGSGLAVSGGNAYVVNMNFSTSHETVMVYNALSGNVVNSSLLPGLAGYSGQIAVDGSDIYLQTDATTIAKYSTAGVLENAAFVTSGNIGAFIVVPSSPVIPEPAIAPMLAGVLAAAALGWRRKKRPT